MSENVIVSIIAGVLSLFGVIITVVAGNEKTNKKVKEHTEVTIYRIDQLEKKVERHNNLIERTYRLEQQNLVQDEKLKVANHRLEDIEKKIERL